MGHPEYLGTLLSHENKDLILVNPFNYTKQGLGHDTRRDGCVQVPLTAINSIEEIGSAAYVRFARAPAVRPVAPPR